MEDDEVELANRCGDFVSLKRFEPVLVQLFRDSAGQWVRISKLASQLPPSVSACWLPSPNGDNAYAVILFFDDDSQWSMTAYYNKERLLVGARTESLNSSEIDLSRVRVAANSEESSVGKLGSIKK